MKKYRYLYLLILCAIFISPYSHAKINHRLQVAESCWSGWQEPVKNIQQYEVIQGQKIARSLTIKSVKSNKIIIQSSDGMIADGENWESPTKTRFELPVGKKLKIATKIYDAGCEYKLELIPKPSK